MFTRFQWVMLILSFLASLTVHLLLFSYSQLKELIALEMGLTYAQAGFVFSLSVFALVALRIPWGFIIDKLGVRASAGLALTLLGIFGFLRGFAVNYETLLLFQLLMGIGLAAVMPCLPKLVAGLFPSEKTVFAIGASISGFAIGDVIALGGTPHLLRLLGDWRNVFYAYGAWALVLTVFWWIYSGELSQKRETGSSSSMGKNLTALLWNRQVWLLSGLYFCSGACYDTLLVWLPSIADAGAGASNSAWLVTSMLPLGFLVASFVIGPLSDRVGLRKPFILLLGMIAGPAIYSIALLPETALWFSAFLVGLCTVGVLMVVLAIPVELPRTCALVGSAVGLITSFGNLGSFFMPTLVGYLRDVTGSFFWGVLLLSLLGESMLILGLPLTETGRKRLKGAALNSASRE